MPDSDTGDVFVDLSNVSKHELLGFSQHHAALSRWDRLKAVWLHARGEPSRFVLVADDSLLRALSRPDQLRLQDLQRRGEAIMVRDADVELLREAARFGGTVLSNDRFVDHLRMSNLDKVTLVGWVVRGDTILLAERPLERLRSAVISARAQKQQLKQMGLGEDSPELGFRWYCRESSCGSDLVAIPALRRGTACCPACGAYLERGQPWRKPLWLKIMHGQSEVNRFVLEDGETVCVGRGTDDDTVSLAEEFEHASDVLALDLRHVELQNSGGRLYAVDLSTARGTALRYPVAGQRNLLSPPTSLLPGEARPVPTGWKIVLGRTPFTIQISGQQGPP
jgi:hypothetical protein